jgi:ABC-type uncharacterized transport system permease subunit
VIIKIVLTYILLGILYATTSRTIEDMVNLGTIQIATGADLKPVVEQYFRVKSGFWILFFAPIVFPVLIYRIMRNFK